MKTKKHILVKPVNFKNEILIVDTSNAGGRIYGKELIERWAEDSTLTPLPIFKDADSTNGINMKVVGFIEELTIEDGILKFKGKVEKAELEKHYSKKAKESDITLTPIGTGIIAKMTIQLDYNLYGFQITLKRESGFYSKNKLIKTKAEPKYVTIKDGRILGDETIELEK